MESKSKAITVTPRKNPTQSFDRATRQHQMQDEKRYPMNNHRDDTTTSTRPNSLDISSSKKTDLSSQPLLASSKSGRNTIDMQYSRSSSCSGSGIPSDSIRDIVHHISSGRKPHRTTSADTKSAKTEDQTKNKTGKSSSIKRVDKSLHNSIMGRGLNPSLYISSSSSSFSTFGTERLNSQPDKNCKNAALSTVTESKAMEIAASNDTDLNHREPTLLNENTLENSNRNSNNSNDLYPSISSPVNEQKLMNENEISHPCITGCVVNEIKCIHEDENHVQRLKQQKNITNEIKQEYSQANPSLGNEEAVGLQQDSCPRKATETQIIMPGESFVKITPMQVVNDPISIKPPLKIDQESMLGRLLVEQVVTDDSDKAIHHLDILPSISSLTLEGFSVAANHPETNSGPVEREAFKNHEARSPRIINSKISNRGVHSEATKTAGFSRSTKSERSTRPQNPPIFHPITESSHDQLSHDKVEKFRSGPYLSSNLASANILNEPTSRLASNGRHCIEQTYDPTYQPKYPQNYLSNLRGRQYEHDFLTYNNITHHLATGGMPIELSRLPHELPHRMINPYPQQQSCLLGNFKGSSICPCFECRDNVVTSPHCSWNPILGHTYGMVPFTSKTTSMYNSSPLYEIPTHRDQIMENHGINHAHHSLTHSRMPPNIGVSEYGGFRVPPYTDNPSSVRGPSFPMTYPVDAAPSLTKVTRSYHDRLKSRKGYESPTKTIHSSMKTFRDLDDKELYESEEKIQALQRVLHLAKAQHDSLLEDRNQRQMGRY